MALPVYHTLMELTVDGSISSVATGVTGVLRAPFKGTVKEIGIMINGATTTADATATCSIAGTNITGGTFTVVQSGSAAGQVNFCSVSGVGNSGATAGGTITAGNACNEGDAIKITMSGSGTGGGTAPYTYAVVTRTI